MKMDLQNGAKVGDSYFYPCMLLDPFHICLIYVFPSLLAELHGYFQDLFRPGIEPRLWQWKCPVLTLGLPGNSLYFLLRCLKLDGCVDNQRRIDEYRVSNRVCCTKNISSRIISCGISQNNKHNCFLKSHLILWDAVPKVLLNSNLCYSETEEKPISHVLGQIKTVE